MDDAANAVGHGSAGYGGSGDGVDVLAQADRVVGTFAVELAGELLGSHFMAADVVVLDYLSANDPALLVDDYSDCKGL